MSGVLTNYPSRLVIARNGRCYPLTKRKRRHGEGSPVAIPLGRNLESVKSLVRSYLYLTEHRITNNAILQSLYPTDKMSSALKIIRVHGRPIQGNLLVSESGLR